MVGREERSSRAEHCKLTAGASPDKRRRSARTLPWRYRPAPCPAKWYRCKSHSRLSHPKSVSNRNTCEEQDEKDSENGWFPDVCNCEITHASLGVLRANTRPHDPIAHLRRAGSHTCPSMRLRRARREVGGSVGGLTLGLWGRGWAALGLQKWKRCEWQGRVCAGVDKSVGGMVEENDGCGKWGSRDV